VTCPHGDGIEYDVEIDGDSDLSSTYDSSGWQSGESWEVTLNQAATWYWRVRARDAVHTDLVSSWLSVLYSSFDVTEP